MASESPAGQDTAQNPADSNKEARNDVCPNRGAAFEFGFQSWALRTVQKKRGGEFDSLASVLMRLADEVNPNIYTELKFALTPLQDLEAADIRSEAACAFEFLDIYGLFDSEAHADTVSADERASAEGRLGPLSSEEFQLLAD